jgi:hypothetical protein
MLRPLYAVQIRFLYFIYDLALKKDQVHDKPFGEMPTFNENGFCSEKF